MTKVQHSFRHSLVLAAMGASACSAPAPDQTTAGDPDALQTTTMQKLKNGTQLSINKQAMALPSTFLRCVSPPPPARDLSFQGALGSSSLGPKRHERVRVLQLRLA